CPSSFEILDGKIILTVDFVTNENIDVSRLFADFYINGTIGQDSILDGIYSAQSNTDVRSITSSVYEITLSITGVHPDSNVVINSVTLANGIGCNYEGGELQIPDNCSVAPGTPCDDGDICTHHDVYVYN